MSSREAWRYEVKVSLGDYVRYVELVSTLGDAVAIRRAVASVALQLLRHGANETPPPSSPQWEGEVVYCVPVRQSLPSREEEAGL